MRALMDMGHEAVCYEEARNWSVSNLVATRGWRPLVEFHRCFPFLRLRLYDSDLPAAAGSTASSLASSTASTIARPGASCETGSPPPTTISRLERRLHRELAEVDVVIIHEWTAIENPALLDLLVRLKRAYGFLLFFHDNHYRILTQPVRMARLGLERCDAVLAFSPSIAAAYRQTLRFDSKAVHVVHEAADTALFRPLPPDEARPMDDALFVGNWGGRDRAAELRAFLLRPARRVRPARRFALYGVRYPPEVLDVIQRFYGVDYRGWLPNHRVPAAFAHTRVVLHVSRRQYAKVLYGTPTIRVFEALACGSALVSTPWRDTDGLFRAGEDYVVAETPAQLTEALQWLWQDEAARLRLGRSGLQRVLAAHTCTHRAEQILGIVARLRSDATLPNDADDGPGGCDSVDVVAARPPVSAARQAVPAELEVAGD
ncbi:MAG: glycosyltransferase [Chloroflexota bacterium]|nr:glycosyltransferase [Chloroflexota bacterium]